MAAFEFWQQISKAVRFRFRYVAAHGALRMYGCICGSLYKFLSLYLFRRGQRKTAGFLCQARCPPLSFPPLVVTAFALKTTRGARY